MSLRWRLALIAGLVTLLSLAAVVIGSGLALERRGMSNLDEELTVQARVVMDEVVASSAPELSAEVSDALQTATGSSAAWVYRRGRLAFGDGVDAPEPLDASFLRGSLERGRCSCAGWRVYSLRQGDTLVQVGRPLEALERANGSYWSVAWIAVLLAALGAGGIIIYAVNRVTEPLERLAGRVSDLAVEAPLPAQELRDEVGALARALQGSLEDLRRTRQREARFLADAAHELRTPVTALLTDLEHHAARPRSAAEDAAVLERARRSARYLRELSSNLLTLSHTEQGLERRELDLFNVAADVVDRLAPLAAAKGLEVSLDGGPISVMGDVMMIERAVENLVGNAIKFTDHGSVRLTVSELNGSAQLEVRDTGVGLPAHTLGRLFEPFERAGEARREGSGLGLAVVKAVMEAHGGQVTLENNHDQPGITARLRLNANRHTRLEA